MVFNSHGHWHHWDILHRDRSEGLDYATPSDRWYENIPYGPLTRETFDMLGASYYDASLSDVQTVAHARGVERGDHLRVKFAELATQGAAEIHLK